MPDILMTICTYDDRQDAERDCARLREAGVRAAVAPCRFVDPEQPGATLFDVVVFDSDLEKAQDLLHLFPPEPTVPDDPVAFRRANNWARAGLFVFGVICVGMVIVGLVSLAFGRLR